MTKSLILFLWMVLVGVTVADNATTVAPTPEPTTVAVMESYGLSVECTSEYMEARLDIKKHSGVRPDTVALEDRNCKITRTEGDYLFFKTQLDGCGTKHNTTDKEIIYYNSIFADTGAGSNNAKISRALQAEFPFKCTYPRTAILSVVSFSPRRKVIYTRASHYGNFTYTMNLFKSDKFENKHDDYPIRIDLNAWLFVETHVESNDSKLALFNDQCWATPSSDPEDSDAYTVIDKGCQKEKKDNMKYEYKKNEPTQHFQVRAFRFTTGDSNDVYLHCRVEVCREGDDNSNCAKGCAGVDRRRRSLTSDASSEILTVGVIKITQGANAQSATGNASSFTTISIIAGVLGVLVIALVAVLVVIYKKRQGVPANVVFKKVSDGEQQLMA